MWRVVEELENAGKYKEVDCLVKQIVATNNFLFTKKRRNPQEEIMGQFDMIKARLSDLEGNLETMEGGSDPMKIILDDKEVEFKHDS